VAPARGGGRRGGGGAAARGGAGWGWGGGRLGVRCERPVALPRDEGGRLDRGDGPALAFPDGFALHAWRGLPVPAEFVAGLDSLTPERIREEENAELRRVMLERYGYDRYLRDEDISTTLDLILQNERRIAQRSRFVSLTNNQLKNSSINNQQNQRLGGPPSPTTPNVSDQRRCRVADD
jgi:hypothetical protein